MLNQKASQVLLKYIDKQDINHIKKIYITKQKSIFGWFFRFKLFYRYYLNIYYKDGFVATARLSKDDKEILKAEVMAFNKYFKNKSLQMKKNLHDELT